MLRRIAWTSSMMIVVGLIGPGCQQQPKKAADSQPYHESLRVPPLQTRVNDLEQQNAELKSQLNQAYVDLRGMQIKQQKQQEEMDRVNAAAAEAMKVKRDWQQASMETQKAKADLIEAQAEMKRLTAAATASEQRAREMEVAGNQLRTQLEMARKDLEAARVAAANVAIAATQAVPATQATTEPAK